MKYTFLSLVLLLICTTANAQFYTVSRKKKYIEISSIENSPEEPSNNRENKLKTDISEKPITISTPDTVTAKKKIKLLSLPLDSIYVTSKFGKRADPFTGKNRKHYGIDLRASSSEIYSIMPGKIKKVGYEKKGLGNYIKIEHGDFEVIYGHLHTAIGEVGDFVSAGTIVGISGNTGRSTAPHLHFAIKYKGKYVDPKPVLEYLKGAL